MVALFALAFQVHLALCGDDGFYIVGLAQSFHPHIVIHAQQNVFQIGTGEAVFRNLTNTAILHIRAEDGGQHHTDLGFTLTAVTLNHHHALSLVGGNQTIADELLQGGDVLRMEQSIQKIQPNHRCGCFGIVGNRHAVSHNSRSALGECAVQQ